MSTSKRTRKRTHEKIQNGASKARNSTGPALPKRLAHALSVIAETLPNPWDESTDYFTPFSVKNPNDGPLDPQTLRVALKIGKRYEIDADAADLAGAAEGWDGETAQGFRLLDAVFRATLTDVTRVFARAQGVVRVRTWVLGRLAGGWLVGLRSETTET
jgi:hypothetical protein